MLPKSETRGEGGAGSHGSVQRLSSLPDLGTGREGGPGSSAAVTLLVTQAPGIKASPLIAMDQSGKSSCL